MQPRILLGLCVATTALSVGGGSLAQDSQGLLDFLPDDPNAFVRTVQERLAGAGQFEGAVNGQLDRATISAINSACRDAGVLADCQLGPLSPEGAAAVVTAIGKLAGEPVPAESEATAAAPESPAVEPAELAAAPTESVATPTEPDAAPTERAAAPVDSAAAPVELLPEKLPPPEALVAPTAAGEQVAAEDWQSSPSFGLSAVPSQQDGTSVVFDIAGTAEERGWVNIYAGGRRPAVPGTSWTFVVDGAFSSESAANSVVRLASQRADGSYLGEIALGTAMDGTGSFVANGVAPADTAFVVPYIQVTYPVGTVASGTLQIKGALLQSDAN
ncbi:hypothetical protein [Devosia sp. CN2-171]|uniref:hypothetical protein n=1 Tax=Devosia sp. CN2-171 TaxID=3400909 RepID=UPI003BF7E99E